MAAPSVLPATTLAELQHYIASGKAGEFGWKTAIVRDVVLDMRPNGDDKTWYCVRANEIHVVGQEHGILLSASQVEAHISIGKYVPQEKMRKQVDKVHRIVANLDLELQLRENAECSRLDSGLLIFEFHVRSRGQKSLVAIEQMLGAGGRVVGKHRSPSFFHLSVRRA